MFNINFIKESQDPKNVGEIIAIKKEKDQLEYISESIYKNLSWSDQQRIDGLLDQRDY
jgi:hypothetical protein